MDNRMINGQNQTNPTGLPQTKKAPKSRLLIILAIVVVVSILLLIIVNLFSNKGSSATSSDLATKSKTFVEAYGNYSYSNPGRNLESIQSFITPSLSKSIQGDSTNNQDYIYLANLQKSKFSIETKIIGTPTIQKTTKTYLVKVPVSEKSTQNGITQTENKTYTVTWSKDNNDWKITDFRTTN